MEKFEIKMKIDYHWKCDAEIDIPEKHREALIEDAETRIFQMIKEGYLMGELNTGVRYGKEIVPEEDEENGLEYSGWWGFKRERNY